VLRALTGKRRPDVVIERYAQRGLENAAAHQGPPSQGLVRRWIRSVKRRNVTSTPSNRIGAAEKGCADEVTRWAPEDQDGWHASMMTDHGKPGI
jgi:hypothetical protein